MEKHGDPAETLCNEPLSDNNKNTSPTNATTDSVANKEEKKDNEEISEEKRPASTKSDDMPA